MKVTKVEPMIVNIPHSDEVQGPEYDTPIWRTGVTAVLVRVETDTGLVGWGEGSVGANAESIHEAIRSAIPIVIGRNPWNTRAIADDFFNAGQWNSAWRPGGANYAYSGIDMALWDICGKDSGQPLYNLFGGLRRPWVDYFHMVRHGPIDYVVRQCRDAVARGYTVFYTKVGFYLEKELEMVAAIRETIGPSRKIRLDANCHWTFNEAIRNLAEFDRYHIDFVEAPVPFEPLRNMVEFRARTPVGVCANEGLGTVGSVWETIRARACDVLCFDQFFVGTLADFHHLSLAAHWEGMQVCKHTHGETGVALAAAHHIMLTLPNAVDGNQQSHQLLSDDIVVEPLPIPASPRWGPPSGPGLGIKVDEGKVAKYRRLFEKDGQYLPYYPHQLAQEERG